MKQSLARKLLGWLGWTLEGTKPDCPQYVLIAAPHTSNWDFPLMLLCAAAFDIKLTWMAKHSLFWPPAGWMLRAVGGMPIERHKNTRTVDTMIDAFSDNEEFVLLVPTEGTRARAEFWKSGFYHIARQASVPIVPSYLNFGQKRAGFGPALETSDDISKDMDYFREFYAGMKGKFPDMFGPIRLHEED